MKTLTMLSDPPRGYGTMTALAERVGLSYRYLFRLRALGVFEPAIRRNARVVFYDLKVCALEIEDYMKTGNIGW